MRDEKGEIERSERRARRLSPELTQSEFDFISSIRHQALRHGRNKTSALSPPLSSLLVGIGDDAAVFKQRGGFDCVVTADLLVEDVDFRLTTTHPALLGHKALAVSLSDIAAMGARARWALLSFGVPPGIWRSDFPAQFYKGFFRLADRFGVTLIGGDVSRTPWRIVVDSIVIGDVSHGSSVKRSGARPGDHIFVTGELGWAAVGLRLLEDGIDGRLARGRRRVIERALDCQRKPEPRLGWGALLGEQGLATAMIDLSDGLSSDLAHLCRESLVGAELDARRLPIDPHLWRLCHWIGLPPLETALHGGEDFELLFTIRPRDLLRLPKRVHGVPATYIGDVTDEPGRIALREGPRRSLLSPQGFRHFS